ncbi:MAG: YdbL family protein [Nevskiales bacterium]
MKHALPFNLIGAALAAGCVTINVYFPAAAAEKAADRIIEDIWGKQPQGGSAPGTEKSTPTQPNSGLLPALQYFAAGTLNFIIPLAEAQADIDISSPAVQQVKAALEARHGQLAAHYASGAVGLTAGGDVAVRDPNLIPLPQRNAVKKLVADDNADRAALYREIAVANGHPEWEADIRATFAKRWVDKAAAGWYYQDAGGTWKQK